MRTFKWKRFVPVMLVGLCCGSAVRAMAFGDDDGKDKPPTGPAAARIEAPAPLTERERRLLDRVEQLEKRVADLEEKAQPAAAVSSSTPAGSDSSAASTASPIAGPTSVASVTALDRESLGITKTGTVAGVSPEKSASGTAKTEKAQPFAFADFTWLNGNPRTKEVPLDTKFFTPEIRADVDYVYDFAHPKDDTIGGSSEIFRSNEVHVTQLGVGGDFHYDNVRARVMTQFGLYSETTPRNDASPARGQWNLADAYRYLSEAYGGYHFNVMHGINVDAGIFMSYVGLFSYYQFDNWAYQPSYVSSNTPWFFNGVRVQIFPSEHLKIEPWLVNGWQSYGRFNNRPGIGMQILWRPNGWLSVLGNQYMLGEDALNTPGRVRYHTDDSIQIKYYDNPERFLDKAAFSLTGDMGCEHGGGVSCAGNSAKGPKQSFLGLHGLQPALVRQRPLWTDHWRRTNQQSWAVLGPVAAHQWSDRGFWNALLYGESRRSIQSLGYIRNLRLDAKPVHYFSMGVQPSGGECTVLFRFRRRNAAGWESGYGGLICLPQRFHGLQRIANKHVVPGSPQDRKPSDHRHPREVLNEHPGIPVSWISCLYEILTNSWRLP